ncbi:MAG: hypothetical protein ACK5Q5_00525 [Planctomycetaceae bacterium]
MSDLKRVSFLAVAFLVLLRLCIGWQFLYEGLWKYDTLDTAAPWTARGYLANAEGPFRQHFRSMVGDFPEGNDPDDLLWLDYDRVVRAWDEWTQNFTRHYGLTEAQQQRLQRLLNGPEQWTFPLSEVPEEVAQKLNKLKQIRQANPAADLADLRYENGQLILNGKTPLKPDEIQQMYRWVKAAMTDRVEDGQVKQTLAMADETGNPILDNDGQPVRMEEGPAKEFAKRVYALEQASTSGIGLNQKLAASLKGDPDRVGVHKHGSQPGVQMGPPESAADVTVELITYGDISKYKDELATYEKLRAKATMPHEFEHLSRLKSKLGSLRVSVVGPVKALDASLKDKARGLLTPEQIQKGPVPTEPTPLIKASQMAMWGLIILGGLLILGLCTRLAALAGAFMLANFYMVMPPWPGVPEAPGVPEHAFIVNKNLIEIVALFGLAALPTGSWFGLDGIVRWIFRRK